MTFAEFRKSLLQQHNGVEIYPDPEQQGILYEENVEALAEAYKTGDDVPPILVQRLPNGDLEIVEGHHRYEASRVAGVSPDIIVKTPVWIRRQKDDSEWLDIEYMAQRRFERYAQLLYQRNIKEVS